jgi:tetratricopeptide (TPR) repeat protein
MVATSPLLDKARQLAAGGQHAAVVEYLQEHTDGELTRSPSLALLYGTAQARLGKHDEGQRWLDAALAQARKRDDGDVERQALNARGALALVGGKIDEAADFFTRALMAASRDGDLTITGRCSNNLGIINHLCGRYAEAIGSWEIAAAAFERVRARHGVAECYHNLSLSYREQGDLNRALAEADRAAAEAEVAGDRTLWALALRGRAETLILQGDLNRARVELDLVAALRRWLPNPVAEAEDLRVAAGLWTASDALPKAEQALRTVIGRAHEYGRPQLEAEATRDLALVLQRTGQIADAQAAALSASTLFSRLGAEGELRKLAAQKWDGDFAAELHAALGPLHAAQELVDAGRYADLLAFLETRPQDIVGRSPMLSLLRAIAHGRLGQLVAAWQWGMIALSRAQQVNDRALEVRSLNVCGAIALETGGLSAATQFFTQAQEAAVGDEDLAGVARCANNLGIIANLQGEYSEAVAAYTRAIAAYEKAGNERGVCESRHNLGITYREQGRLDDAMKTAEAAVAQAEHLGDERLKAQALGGVAEIQVARGEPQLAIRLAESALAVHRALQDAVRESEDLRILGRAFLAAGQVDEARDAFTQVIDRATKHGRPLLVGLAQRDLAHVLFRGGEHVAARELVDKARAAFERLGARGELIRLAALVRDAERAA